MARNPGWGIASANKYDSIHTVERRRKKLLRSWDASARPPERALHLEGDQRVPDRPLPVLGAGSREPGVGHPLLLSEAIEDQSRRKRVERSLPVGSAR